MNSEKETKKIEGGSKFEVIQTKIITGRGSGEFYLEVNFDFIDESFLRIESSRTSIEVYKTKLITNNKISFNAWVYKSIVYETVDKELGLIDNEGIITVNGLLKHKTKRIPLNGFIDIIAIKDDDKVNPNKDCVEIVDSYITAEVEDESREEPIRNVILGYRLQYNRIKYLYEDERNRYFNIFESSSKPIYKYKRLNTNMLIKIDVRTFRMEELSIKI